MKSFAAVFGGGLFSLCYTLSSRNWMFWVAMAGVVIAVAYVRN